MRSSTAWRHIFNGFLAHDTRTQALQSRLIHGPFLCVGCCHTLNITINFHNMQL